MTMKGEGDSRIPDSFGVMVLIAIEKKGPKENLLTKIQGRGPYIRKQLGKMVIGGALHENRIGCCKPMVFPSPSFRCFGISLLPKLLLDFTYQLNNIEISFGLFNITKHTNCASIFSEKIIFSMDENAV